MEERETAPHPSRHRPYTASLILIGGRAGALRSLDLCLALSPVTTVSPPPVTQPAGHDPGLPLGTFGWNLPQLSSWRDPRLRNPSGAHLDWGGGCGTGSRLAQLY